MAFRIPNRNVPTLRAKLDKLNAKVAKLNTKHGMTLAPVTLTVVGTDKTEIRDEITGLVKRVVEYTLVEVTGDTPQVGGFVMAATLQHVTADDGERLVIIRSVPGETIDPRFRTANPSDCDHCRTRRFRIDTFVVRNVETGEQRQVGRNCLADFLGGLSPEAVAKYAEYLMAARELGELSEDEEGYGSFGNDRNTESVVNLLAWVRSAIRKNGWLSRGKAREQQREGAATVDQVFYMQDHLTRPCKDAYGRRDYLCAEKTHFEPTADDVTEAETILEWGRDWSTKKSKNDPDNEYVWNLSVALRREYVEARSCGLVGSLVAVYDRETQRDALNRAKNAEIADSDYIGKVGDKLSLVLLVRGTHTFEGQYGATTVVNFSDDDGNLFVWFASGYHEYTVGEKVTVKGTVKKHEERKGIKQTTLTRCKIS